MIVQETTSLVVETSAEACEKTSLINNLCLPGVAALVSVSLTLEGFQTLFRYFRLKVSTLPIFNGERGVGLGKNTRLNISEAKHTAKTDHPIVGVL